MNELEITYDTDNGSVVVSIEDNKEVLFVLNPDFPQETQQLYIALSYVRSIEVRPRQEK